MTGGGPVHITLSKQATGTIHDGYIVSGLLTSTVSLIWLLVDQEKLDGKRLGPQSKDPSI